MGESLFDSRKWRRLAGVVLAVVVALADELEVF